MTRRGNRGGGNRGERPGEKTVAESEGVVLKVLEFGRPERDGYGTSKQMPPDAFEPMIQNGEIVRPPYDPFTWALLMEQNIRLARCIWVTAMNTVGLGMELGPMDDSAEFAESNVTNIKREREEFMPLFKYPNPDMSFEELMTYVKVDEESMGQGYLEVSRDGKGEIDGFYHVPGHTIRVRTDRKGFLQLRSPASSEYGMAAPGADTKVSPQKVYFKNFGDVTVYDKSTGKVATAGLPLAEQANELIMFKIYSPRTSYYGIPRYVASAPAIAGRRLASIRNVSFFENDATPRLAVIVNGGTLGAESVKMIEEFISSKGKGPMNFGRVMLLQAQPKEGVPDPTPTGQITLMPLTVGVNEDSSFSRYTMMSDEEIREAFGIGKIFLGTADDVNRAVAMTMKQVTAEQVFEPEIRRYEYRINMTIMRALGAKYTQFNFRRPSVVDIASEAMAYAALAAAGGVAPQDMRKLLGFDPFEADWAKTPLPLLKMGLMEGKPTPPVFGDQADVAAQMARAGGGAAPAPAPEGKKLTEEDFASNKVMMAKILSRVERLYENSTGIPMKMNLIAEGDVETVLKTIRESVEK